MTAAGGGPTESLSEPQTPVTLNTGPLRSHGSSTGRAQPLVCPRGPLPGGACSVGSKAHLYPANPVPAAKAGGSPTAPAAPEPGTPSRDGQLTTALTVPWSSGQLEGCCDHAQVAWKRSGGRRDKVGS